MGSKESVGGSQSFTTNFRSGHKISGFSNGWGDNKIKLDRGFKNKLSAEDRSFKTYLYERNIMLICIWVIVRMRNDFSGILYYYTIKLIFVK